MDVNTLPAYIESTTSGKVRIVRRFLEHQRADRLRIMRRFAEPPTAKVGRVFVTPRRTILRVPPLPPRRRAEFDAIQAAQRGDHAPLRKLVGERLGEPDALAVVALRDVGDEVPFLLIDEFIRDPRAYVTKESHDAAVAELVEETRRGIKLFPEHRRALAYLEPGRSPEETLRRQVEAIGHTEGWRPRLIANRIRQEGPETPDKPAEPLDGLIATPGGTDEDLDWIVAARFLDELAVRADLDQRTTLAFLLSARGHSGQEIAERLGVSPSNARKLMQRGRARLAPLRGDL
jgi:DNA-binding NarL/FixJ family response regulator